MSAHRQHYTPEPDQQHQRPLPASLGHAAAYVAMLLGGVAVVAVLTGALP